jgi:hypothetical protein
MATLLNLLIKQELASVSFLTQGVTYPLTRLDKHNIKVRVITVAVLFKA